MCGIIGALSFNNSGFQVTEDYIVAMRDKMEHRGPDGSGVWISADGQVGFGHRRLSIIDLSESASQPMCNEDGSVWITFNGEIYNHAEIRAELERSGRYLWKTRHSDTEVILHAYQEWGIECIHRFRGMFAFGIWDAKEKCLWLVRDRIGVKPLYYSVHHGRLVFGSTINALLKDPDQKRSVDHEALYHYLSFLTTPSPQTLFAGVKKLPPGCWLRVNLAGDIREHRYWDVWDHAQPLPTESEDDIAGLVLEELKRAVQLRKVSDVPVGIFLSGGLDSSTNAALFSEGEPHPVRTFSIGYDQEYGSNRNELVYARKMASVVGADHHEKILTQRNLLDFLPRMVELQDEPIGDPVCVPLFYLSQLARDNGAIVCQLGEGADELFCGYPKWKAQLQLQAANRWHLPQAAKSLALGALQLTGQEHKLHFEYLRRGAEGLPIFWGGAEAFYETEKKKLLAPQLRRELAGFSSWHAIEQIWDRFQQKAWETSDLHWMSYLDLNLRLPELLLMRVDKMSMGASLEARVPFLDHKFVELALSIPARLKTRNGVLKYMLKKSVRGVIPDEFIDRKKQGFGVPIYEWFFAELGEYARKEIKLFCEQSGLLDHKHVMRVLDEKRSKESWYLLNLALWWKQYIAN